MFYKVKKSSAYLKYRNTTFPNCHIEIQTDGRKKLVIIWADKKVISANVGMHPCTKGKLNKKDKEALSWTIRPTFSMLAMKLPVKITLIRVAPRALDGEDNLRMAFKSIKDYIALLFFPNTKPGIADEYPCFTWHYLQSKGEPKEYTIQIHIEEVRDETLDTVDNTNLVKETLHTRQLQGK